MKTVLVIDDDPAIRTIAIKRLQAEKVQTLTANDGAEGLRIIREARPDVVLLDLMMPNVHGYTVLKQVRDDPDLDSVKIIVTSAKSFAGDKETAERLGANRYLTKPYDLQEMWELVAELLGETRPHFCVRFWGTRGSIATPGPGTVKYGGNTSCTEVRCGKELLILDAGTGIRALGDSLMADSGHTPIKAHLFISHTHWDHIQGFPFFAPAFVLGNEFIIYNLHGVEKPLEKVFQGQMDSDYFPVRLSDMKAKLTFRELQSDVSLGEARISYFFLNHPGVAIGFRIQFGGRTLVYLTDHENYGRLSPGGPKPNPSDLEVVHFADQADLFICEAQYTEEEYVHKKGWGHSTFLDVLERAAQARVKRLAIYHHDPAHDDRFLDGILGFCQKTIAERNYAFSCLLAREGMAIEL